MRLWRIEENRVTDALSNPDTFALGMIEDFSVSMVNREHYQALHDVSGQYDYICSWEQHCFPVNDKDSRSLDGLRRAKQDAIASNLYFKQWVR